MIYKKGRWQASYKDTFSLDMTLSPIIYAGLSKFHDVLEQRYKEDKCIGIPMPYCSDPEASLPDEEVQAWLDDIKKMMYAFENKEPDIRDYKFYMKLVPVEEDASQEIYESAKALNKVGAISDEELLEYKPSLPRMSKPYTIECDNEEEYAKYREDCDEHERLVQEGLELTFKRWTNLWW